MYFLIFQVLSRSHAWSVETPISSRHTLIKHCLHSRAHSTISKYIREVNLFFKFQTQNNIKVSLPASITDVSIYLSHLVDKHKVSVAAMAHAALKWVHSILPIDNNPLDASICKNLVEAEKRSRPGPIKKKEPATLELVTSIVDSYAHEGATLKDLRFATMCVISFVCLLRSDELINIKASDIIVHSDYIVIKIPRSKTDVYRDGQEVFLHKSAKTTCPYILLVRYLSQVNIVLNSSETFLGM